MGKRIEIPEGIKLKQVMVGYAWDVTHLPRQTTRAKRLAFGTRGSLAASARKAGDVNKWLK